MKMFDHHIHMTSRTTDDYQAMAAAGIVAVIEPAFWVGQPRRNVGTFEDYFLSLVGWERFRAGQFGILHFCTIGLNPKETNNTEIASGVMDLLPEFLEKESVVGVGEIGFDDQTPEETRFFEAQMQLAIEFNLPVLIHTPHRDKKAGTKLTLDIVRASGIAPGRVLVDHNTEETIEMTLDSGCWAGHSIYPHTKMDEPRMVALLKKYGTDRITINSAADWGISDPLKVPKTAQAMREAGFSERDIETTVWRNPVAFFSQSGRLNLGEHADEPSIDQRQLWEGNSVLRGQTPVVKIAS
ncbi:MAG: TatD family hydrolase [Gammaproteobacteria bacterium]|nr:TatD family hydrolase [Gammaproteobacteria bacterium]